MLITKTAKITGVPGKSGWAQVHEFKPDDPEKLTKRGKIFVVISTKIVEGDVSNITSGREILSRIHEDYYGNLLLSAYNALKETVEKVSQEFIQTFGDVEMISGAVLGETVYFAAMGGARVIVNRGGTMATILETKGSDVQTVSGFCKPGDEFLLSTGKFFEVISKGVLKGALSSDDPEKSAETLTATIHSYPNSSDIAAIIIRFEAEVKTPIEEVVKTSEEMEKVNLPVKKSIWPKLPSLPKLPFFKLRKPIYIRNSVVEGDFSQSKKRTMSIGLILLCLLVVSTLFGIRQKRIKEVQSKYQSSLEVARNEVDQAISLASIDTDQSRSLFADSEKKLQEILVLNVKDSKIDELKAKIEQSREKILGEYVGNPDLFLNLTLLTSGFKGNVIKFSNGTIYVLDGQGKRLVSVELSTKKSKTVAGPTTLDGASDVAATSDNVYALLPDGIYEISSKNKVIDKTWQDGAVMNTFADNIYLLDKASGIYKYQNNSGVFAEKKNWITKGDTPDFSSAMNFGIDGSIYILMPNAKIVKFSQGSRDLFSISGVIPEIGSVDAIYADPDNQFIYLLDKAAKRVVIVDKKGKYQAQYTGDQMADAVGIIASESQKKLILLTGDKLLTIDLRNF